MGGTGVGTLCLWLCAVVCLAHGQNYVNVAINKTYTQISKVGNQGPSSNAANGDTSGIFPDNCIYTGFGNGDWWEVDLGETYAVFSITVWARTNFTRRLYPSKITVDGQTCASITSFPTDTREKTVTCSSVMYGQTVRITRQPTPQQSGNDRTLNLCEMEIWGCVSGLYGDQCSTACSPGCQDTCNLQTGQCSCKAGYTGDKCAGCVDHRHGDMCTLECQTTHCLQCDQDSGVCTQCALNSHLLTPQCTECQDGYFKTSSGMCDQCSTDCDSQSCDKQSGRCHGCVDHRHGYMCTLECQTTHCLQCDQVSGECTQCALNSHLLTPQCTECQDRYFKTSSGTCDQCSTDCDSQICDKQSGRCHGCVVRHYGALCNRSCLPANCLRCHQDTGVCTECEVDSNLQPHDCKDCVDGYYKRSDNTGCDACRGTCQSGTVCDKTTGLCPLCPPGKQGHYCDEDCDAGTYGENCTGHCGHCLIKQDTGHCNAVTRHCMHGCQDGWQPSSLCNEECDDGRWGFECTMTCGQCKEGAVCNKTDGQCPLCEPGWYEPTCDTPCQDGWYGNNCSMQCGSCLNGETCSKSTGHCSCIKGKQPPSCTTDCQNKRYGQDCAESCGQCRGDQTCEPVTGHCSDGCQPGWTDLTRSDVHLCQSECADGFYGEGCNQTCGNCQVSSECRHDTGQCTGQCVDGFTGLYCAEVKKAKDETVNTSVIIGAVVGTGLFIGVCIIILAVVLWALRSRILSRQSRTTTDNPEVTASPTPVRPADRGKANAVFHGVTDEEEHYESVGDIPMTTKHAHPGTSTHPDTTTCVYPGTSTHPDTMSHVTEADNPYDLPAEQYSNTGEVHLYDPWRVSRATQPDDDINMTAHSADKGKVPGEKGNDYENPN